MHIRFVRRVDPLVDYSPPTGSITINGGAASTTSTSVTLNLSASDAGGVPQMQFSNDNVNWSSPESYAITKAWTLTSGAGIKTVYVKFNDVVGNWSGACTDTITLAPSPSPSHSLSPSPSASPSRA